MGKPITIVVPDFIYDIYEDAANALGDISLPEVMSAALQAYAQFLFEEMRDDGLVEDSKKLTIHHTKTEK